MPRRKRIDSDNAVTPSLGERPFAVRIIKRSDMRPRRYFGRTVLSEYPEWQQIAQTIERGLGPHEAMEVTVPKNRAMPLLRAIKKQIKTSKAALDAYSIKISADASVINIVGRSQLA